MLSKFRFDLTPHLIRVDEYVDSRRDAKKEVTELDDESPPQRFVFQLA